MKRVNKRNPCLKFILMAFMFAFTLTGLSSNADYLMPNTVVTYAVDEIPNNDVYGNQGANQNNKVSKPDANSVFGDAQITPDSTGYSEGIGNILQKGASFIVATCNYIFMFGLIVHFAIESVMMAFPIMATVMSTKVPYQLYSHECAKVCGVTHNYQAGGGNGVGGSGGGVGSGASANTNNGEQQGFVGKFTSYFKERMVTLILAGVILVMCATGLMPMLINAGINWVIGLFIK